MTIPVDVVDDLAIELFRKERWARGEVGSVADLEAAWKNLPSPERASLKSESRQIIFNLLQALGLTIERKPVIQPGEEWKAAVQSIVNDLRDCKPEVGEYVAVDVLHRAIDAVEAVRYAGDKPTPIVDRPEA